MKEKFSKLIDVKSIVTLALVAVLCFMTVTGQGVSDLFNSAVMLVLGFFFGKNLKNNNEIEEAAAPISAATEEKEEER